MENKKIGAEPSFEEIVIIEKPSDGTQTELRISSVCFDELTGDDYSYFRERSYNDWFELYKKNKLFYNGYR